MEGLRDLYQEVIFDHNRRPRNFGRLECANRTAEGFNPLCGDQVNLYLHVDDDERITKVAFDGHGCAISTASASMLTELVKGRTVAEAETLFQRFHAMIMGEDIDGAPVEGMGKLEVLAGVRAYPSRVKCATLAWHTVHAALSGEKQPVTTE